MSKRKTKQEQPEVPRQDYDSPWKEILDELLENCFKALFPEAHAAIDWERGVEFMDKELQQIVADAELGRRLADKMVKVWLRDGGELRIIVHVEVQGDPQVVFEERMYVYSFRGYDRFHCPIASFAILTDENPDWRPTEFGYSVLGTELRLKFTSAKVLDFARHWATLAASDDPFSIVLMAHLKARETRHSAAQRYRWKMKLVKGLYEHGYSPEYVRKLFRIIDWMMKLPAEMSEQFKVDLAKFEEERKMKYVTSIERILIEEVKQEAQQEQAVGLATRLLQLKLGALSARVEKRIRKLSREKAEQLIEALLNFTSPRDLNAWLKEHAG